MVLFTKVTDTLGPDTGGDTEAPLLEGPRRSGLTPGLKQSQ